MNGQSFLLAQGSLKKDEGKLKQTFWIFVLILQEHALKQKICYACDVSNLTNKYGYILLNSLFYVFITFSWAWF